MKTTTRILLSASGALLALSGASAAALAQHTLAPVHVTASATARADKLHDQAMNLPTETRYAKKAARLHEESAELRAVDDAQAVGCLRTAAFLRYYAGDRRAGVNLMERAATRAADLGDVARAADAYIDAAYIAQEVKDNARARELGRRAQLLTNSPLLSDAQRLALRNRLTGAQGLAMK
jgi:hypothetical protein